MTGVSVATLLTQCCRGCDARLSVLKRGNIDVGNCDGLSSGLLNCRSRMRGTHMDSQLADDCFFTFPRVRRLLSVLRLVGTSAVVTTPTPCRTK